MPPSPTASLYTLTKGAVAGFNRSLVRDLGPRGITVNTVHPGPTDTDMNPDGGPVAKIVGPGMAIGRYGKPYEIASVGRLSSPAPRRPSSPAPTSSPTAASRPDPACHTREETHQ